jgi:hypothetical protein
MSWMEIDAAAAHYGGVKRSELWDDKSYHQPDKPTSCKHLMELTPNRFKGKSTFTKLGIRTWGLASVDNNYHYSN